MGEHEKRRGAEANEDAAAAARLHNAYEEKDAADKEHEDAHRYTERGNEQRTGECEDSGENGAKGKKIRRAPRGFWESADEIAAVESVARHLPKMAEWRGRAVVIHDNGRIIDDAIATSNDLETEFCVLARPYRSAKSANLCKDGTPYEKVDRWPVVNRSYGPNRPIAHTGRTTPEP